MAGRESGKMVIWEVSGNKGKGCEGRGSRAVKWTV